MSSSLPLIPLEDAIVLPGMASRSTSPRRRPTRPSTRPSPPRPPTTAAWSWSPGTRAASPASASWPRSTATPACCPTATAAATLRALHRAELGRAEAAGGALRIDVTERPDPTDVGEDVLEHARAYRAVIESILEERGATRIAAFLHAIEAPGELADTAGFSPDLNFSQKLQLLETLDLGERLAEGHRSGCARCSATSS